MIVPFKGKAFTDDIRNDIPYNTVVENILISLESNNEKEEGGEKENFVEPEIVSKKSFPGVISLSQIFEDSRLFWRSVKTRATYNHSG